MTITLNVNDVDRRIEADVDTPLLWVLRDELQLTGTKYGCGLAQCGACTVHADGAPIRACVTPVGAMTGYKIRTIEGLRGEHAAAEGMGRAQRAAVRLLSIRPDHGGRGAAGDESQTERCRHHVRDVRQHLSLRDILANPRGDKDAAGA